MSAEPTPIRECDHALDYLYSMLEGEAKARFEAHLATCARCQAELASFGQVRKAAQEALPPVEPGERLTGALHAQLMHAASHRKPRGKVVPFLRRVISHPGYAAAAALVLVGGAVGLQWSRGRLLMPPPAAQSAAPAPTVTAAPTAAPPAAEPAAQAADPSAQYDKAQPVEKPAAAAQGAKRPEPLKVMPEPKVARRPAANDDLLLDEKQADGDAIGARLKKDSAPFGSVTGSEGLGSLGSNKELQGPAGGRAASHGSGAGTVGGGSYGASTPRPAARSAAPAPSRQQAAAPPATVAQAPAPPPPRPPAAAAPSKKVAGGDVSDGYLDLKPREESARNRRDEPSADRRMAGSEEAERPARSTPKGHAQPEEPQAGPAPTEAAPALANAPPKSTAAPADDEARRETAKNESSTRDELDVERGRAASLAQAGRCEEATSLYGALERKAPQRLTQQDRLTYTRCLRSLGRLDPAQEELNQLRSDRNLGRAQGGLPQAAINAEQKAIDVMRKRAESANVERRGAVAGKAKAKPARAADAAEAPASPAAAGEGNAAKKAY